MKALFSNSNDGVTKGTYEVNQLCILDEKVKYQWFVGYIKDKNADWYIFDHPEKTPRTRNKYWNYPKKADIQCIENEHILEVIVKGEWMVIGLKKLSIYFKQLDGNSLYF